MLNKLMHSCDPEQFQITLKIVIEWKMLNYEGHNKTNLNKTLKFLLNWSEPNVNTNMTMTIVWIDFLALCTYLIVS